MTFGMLHEPMSEASWAKAVLIDCAVALRREMLPPLVKSFWTSHGAPAVHLGSNSSGMKVCGLPRPAIGAWMLDSIGLPCLSAATRAYILAVEPMAKPFVPP